MELKEFLEQKFTKGLTYSESAQLCQHLYCTVGNVPVNLHSQCTKEELAKVFSELAKTNFITTEPIDAVLYGSNFHKVTDVGHWIEIIASLFKSKNTIDTSISREMIICLTNRTA